jgi:two-component system, chemotaxis family, sensor kinase CheA
MLRFRGRRVPDPERSMDQSAQEDAMARGSNESPEQAMPPESEDPGFLIRNLNEAASLLARSEPGDTDALRQVAKLLGAALEGSEFPQSGRAFAESAWQITRRIANGNSKNAEADFAEAARLMDELSVAIPEEPTAESDLSPAPPSAPIPFDDDPEPPPLEVPTSEAVTAPPTEAPAAPGWTLPADTDPSLVADFVAECREYVQQAEACLLSLESDPDQAEAINTVFRAFHTIKGTSGFLGIELLSELAHKAENLLSRMRDKEIQCVGGYADLALRSVDAIKTLVEGVQAVLGGDVLAKPGDYDDLIRILKDPEGAGISGDPEEASVASPRLGDMLVAEGVADRETVEAVAAKSSGPIGTALVSSGAVGALDVAQALRAQKKIARRVDDGTDSSVRVRTDRLDRLIDMVGELVIAQSMVSQDDDVVSGRKPDLVRKVTHAGKIVRELQDLSMSMRMVPLKPTFLKMARLVRDLAHKGGRLVEFATSGEETEIDRNMVDVLADPLVHMIRNAVDHGLEPPEDREKAGKTPTGHIHLSAYHAGGNVVVELRDDGRGLNREKIASKAIERGLIESDKAMSDGAVYNLIFEAGFSTADKVTEVSGRGVGMDVVRRAVQALNGRIEIQSELGKGTTFAVKLPLTLAVTDGMLIRVGRQRFILPTASIHISFRPEPSAVSSVLGRGEMVMLRGNLIPVLRLHRVFGIPDAAEDPTEALLVIVDDGERRSAILVDELLGQQQVVAKSLGAGTGKVAGVAGGAILGDGRVGLILDPSGLIALSRGGQSSEHRALVDALAA